MKFDPSLIKEAAKEDFDKTWQQGREYLGKPSLNERYPRNTYSFGAVHPIFDTIQKLREAYIRLGFNEAMNPVMVEARTFTASSAQRHWPYWTGAFTWLGCPDRTLASRMRGSPR